MCRYVVLEKYTFRRKRPLWAGVCSYAFWDKEGAKKIAKEEAKYAAEVDEDITQTKASIREHEWETEVIVNGETSHRMILAEADENIPVHVNSWIDRKSYLLIREEPGTVPVIVEIKWKKKQIYEEMLAEANRLIKENSFWLKDVSVLQKAMPNDFITLTDGTAEIMLSICSERVRRADCQRKEYD